MEARDELGRAVQIRLGADPERLSGSIRVSDRPERRFSGWLELMRELEGARRTPAQGSDDPSNSSLGSER